MTRRPMIIPFAILLLACLAVLPACKKNKPDAEESGGGGGGPTSGPVAPSTVNSEYVLFAQLKAKDLRENPVFTEVKAAFLKAGGMAEWDQAEQGIARGIGGIKPTDVDLVTVCVTEVPPRDRPKFILILATSKPIEKAGVRWLGGPEAKPDARGFYGEGGSSLIHFPDDKTLVMLHPDLAKQYLDGYAKNRTGWPMTAELTRAASGHLLFATVQLQKLPSELLSGPDSKEFAPLLAARTITLTADLKGKEASIAAHATFSDGTAADKAKGTALGLLQKANGEVEKFLNDKKSTDLGIKPIVQAAHRALKEAKIEVSGSDLTIAGSYKADFDIGAMVVDAVPRIRSAAERTKELNNLKQIGLALNSYADAYAGGLPIHGVGPNGALLKNPNDKPLLSWRVAILPYMEQQALYEEFKLNEPWDSEHNKKLIEKMPKLYAPPASKPGKPGYTHLQMVVGPRGMPMNRARFPTSIPDGTSNTIAVIEVAESVIWTKPADLMLPGKDVPKDLKKKFGGLHPNGFQAVLWDGSVRFISDSISDQTLSAALTPAGGEVLGSDWDR